MRIEYRRVLPDTRIVQERVPAKIVQLQRMLAPMHSPCCDPGRRGTEIRGDGRTSVSGSVFGMSLDHYCPKLVRGSMN